MRAPGTPGLLSLHVHSQPQATPQEHVLPCGIASLKWMQLKQKEVSKNIQRNDTHEHVISTEIPTQDTLDLQKLRQQVHRASEQLLNPQHGYLTCSWLSFMHSSSSLQKARQSFLDCMALGSR